MSSRKLSTAFAFGAMFRITQSRTLPGVKHGVITLRRVLPVTEYAERLSARRCALSPGRTPLPNPNEGVEQSGAPGFTPRRLGLFDAFWRPRSTSNAPIRQRPLPSRLRSEFSAVPPFRRAVRDRLESGVRDSDVAVVGALPRSKFCISLQPSAPDIPRDCLWV